MRLSNCGDANVNTTDIHTNDHNTHMNHITNIGTLIDTGDAARIYTKHITNTTAT